jgi:hypothetical protein
VPAVVAGASVGHGRQSVVTNGLDVEDRRAGHIVAAVEPAARQAARLERRELATPSDVSVAT